MAKTHCHISHCDASVLYLAILQAHNNPCQEPRRLKINTLQPLYVKVSVAV